MLLAVILEILINQSRKQIKQTFFVKNYLLRFATITFLFLIK